MNWLSKKLPVNGCLFFAFTVIGCGSVYINAYWLKHNPEAALPATIIVAVVGGVITFIALISTYIRER
jgi:Flp pilus assembly protein protease CpaA